MLKYVSTNPNVQEEYFSVYGYGRYLYVANTKMDYSALCIDDINIFTGDPPQCAMCSADSYCPGNKTNYTIPCPNSMYSLPGSYSVAQCACPVRASLLPDVNCTCDSGYYQLMSASAPLGGWQCNLCPKGSFCYMGIQNDCPPGFYCPNTGMFSPIICPAGSYCQPGASAPVVCPSETYTLFPGAYACLPCTACQLGSYQTTACSSKQNRVCTACTAAKPSRAIFATTLPSCPWVCDNGYWGNNCDSCPPNYWCRFGVQNRCPLNSMSPALSSSQSSCVCALGYMSSGKITGTSPCVLCPAGIICNGVPVQDFNISVTPLVNVTTQAVLGQTPVPPVDSMATLFVSVPSTLSSIVSSLSIKNATVHLRKVCRRTYCVACDEGSSTCIRQITVELQSGGDGTLSASVTSIQRNVMYIFAASPNCTPQIKDLSAEFVSSNVVVISSLADVTSVKVVCSASALGVSIPVAAP